MVLLPYVAVLASVVPIVIATWSEIYVSPRGSDLFLGTKLLHFKTLERAQRAVRVVNGNIRLILWLMWLQGLTTLMRHSNLVLPTLDLMAIALSGKAKTLISQEGKLGDFSCFQNACSLLQQNSREWLDAV
jgi:hypothetical protein